jgi:hypothetical protein
MRYALMTTQLLHQARDTAITQAEADERLEHQARAMPHTQPVAPNSCPAGPMAGEHGGGARCGSGLAVRACFRRHGSAQISAKPCRRTMPEPRRARGHTHAVPPGTAWLAVAADSCGGGSGERG